MKTLLLDTLIWDLCKDAGGDIAVADEPYRLAQDVASALRLFAAELYYDTTRGIPYWEDILGQLPPTQYLKTRFDMAALEVPGVVAAECFLIDLVDRKLTGTVRVTDKLGIISNVQF